MAEEPPERNGRRTALGIQGRLTLWFVAGAVATVAVGLAVIHTSGMASIQGTLGQTYCQIASRVVDNVENAFSGNRSFVRRLATDVLTTEVVMEHDRFSHAMPPLKRPVGDFHPQLANRLGVLARLDPTIKRVSVYHREGDIIASSNETTGEAGPPWFKPVGRTERHFTFVETDAARRILVIAMPVWGGIDIVGYVVAEYYLDSFLRDVSGVRFGASGEAALVDYAGVPLTGEPKSHSIKAMGAKPPAERGGARAVGTPAEPYWVLHRGEERLAVWRRMSCVAPLPLINSMRARFDLPPWSLVITQSPEESYAALRNSLDTLAIMGALVVVGIGLAGGLLAWHITAPVQQLREGVRRFARGERDRRVEVDSRNEIGELADEFNRMAERVTASENELRAFAQAVSDAADAIIMTDPEGNIYYANPAFEKITGYGVDEVKGRNPSVLRSPQTPPGTFAQIWEAVSNGRHWRGELWNRRKDGDIYPVDLTISPVHDERGALVSVLGVHRDITLAREYQDRLEREVEARSREIAETRGLTAMGRMASMIAHDLRNSLSTIKMNLQILSRKHQDPEGAEHEHCRMGLEQVHYMEEILRDMLSFARPERLQTEWWDVEQILDGALAAVSHSLAERDGIEIRRADGRGLPKIHGDRVKLVQVIQNLIDNALQAMGKQGCLTLTTRLAMDGPEPLVEVRLQDSGEGIPPEALEEIFEPFFTTRTKGTGLGLAIVKRIMEQHGGAIVIASEVGEGTVVTLSLPTVPIEGKG